MKKGEGEERGRRRERERREEGEKEGAREEEREGGGRRRLWGHIADDPDDTFIYPNMCILPLSPCRVAGCVTPSGCTEL